MAALEYLTVYIFGAFLYGAIEVLWRAWTHWTMLVIGGFCFLSLYIIAKHSRDKFWKKSVMGAMIITTVEFVTGAIVNVALGWRVWDYSHMPLNLMGQICLTFSIYWLALSALGLGLCKLLERRFFSRWKTG